MKTNYIEYEEFKNKVIKAIEGAVGDDRRVSVKSCDKNNGVVLDGVVLLEDNINISPTLYLNGYYEEYLRGMSISDIVSVMLDCFDRYRAQQSYDLSFFENRETVREMIAYKLVNYEMNSKLLEKIPHRRIMDLAMVYFVYIRDGVYGNGSVQIRNEHMEMWNFTEEDLFIMSQKNTPEIFKPLIKNMGDIIDDMMDGISIDRMGGDIANDVGRSIYVLTNNNGVNGAGCMMYPEIIEEFARELNCNLYILPSSVHEVIIAPDNLGNDVEALRSMVREINRTELRTSDILSNEVYYFDRTERKLIVA